MPPQRVLEATRGAILARGAAGVPLLVEQLQSADKAPLRPRVARGPRAARPRSDRGPAGRVGPAAPQRQGLLILALADRGDAAVLPAVLAGGQERPGHGAERGGPRARAIGRRLVRARAAGRGAGRRRRACRKPRWTVLADLPGQEVDDDLAARLAEGRGQDAAVLIELAGRRPIAAAVPALLKAADDPDAADPRRGPHGAGIDHRAARPAGADRPGGQPAECGGRCGGRRRPWPPPASGCPTARPAPRSWWPRWRRRRVPVKCRFLEILGADGRRQGPGGPSAPRRRTPMPEIRDAGQPAAGRVDERRRGAGAAWTWPRRRRTRSTRSAPCAATSGWCGSSSCPTPSGSRCAARPWRPPQRDAEKKLVLEVLGRYPERRRR